MLRWLLLACASPLWIACSYAEAPTSDSPAAESVTTAPEPDAAGPILVLGDSLSAGFGIDLVDSWVNLMRKRLAAEGYPQAVVNASVSGETTDGGLARLPKLLDRHAPSMVVIELGANDGLRGLPPKRIQSNLESMIGMARQAGATCLLLGMRLPPNYGPAYTEAFHQAFHDAARRGGAELVPFFLAPIATDESWFQPDRIHPTAAAQPLLLDHVWPAIGRVLESTQAEQQPG